MCTKDLRANSVTATKSQKLSGRSSLNKTLIVLYNNTYFLQITSTKLQWNAKPKIGSLDNASYKPGGGDKKIESLKMDFKDRAKSKVGSKENMKHLPGGGEFKVS